MSVLARGMAVILVSALTLASVSDAALARVRPDTPPEVALQELPPEAREVHAQIRAGGPFHYDRDGVIFGNRERILPLQPRGYYHEYTVQTPGSRTRGARRVICGGPKTAPDVCFYTDDHYQSFRRIRP